MIVFLPRRPPLGNFDTYKGYGRHMFWQLAKCDWLGVAIVLGWAVCFILALEWGVSGGSSSSSFFFFFFIG